MKLNKNWWMEWTKWMNEMKIDEWNKNGCSRKFISKNLLVVTYIHKPFHKTDWKFVTASNKYSWGKMLLVPFTFWNKKLMPLRWLYNMILFSRYKQQTKCVIPIELLIQEKTKINKLQFSCTKSNWNNNQPMTKIP